MASKCLAKAESVSILGLGNMGSAIASAFLKKGYPTTVWNRTAKRAQALVLQGATIAESPADCARSSSLIIICVLSNEALHNILEGIPTLRGCTVLSLTSSRPQEVKEASETVTHKLNAQGYLHGWILSPPSAVQDHRGAVLYGGPRTAFMRLRDACETLGPATWVDENPQRVALIEMGAMSMVAGFFAGFMQSLAVIKTDAMDQVQFTVDILLPLLEIFREWLPRLAEQDQKQSHEASGDASSLTLASAIVTNATETARERGVSTRLIQGLADVLAQGVEQGKGADDLSAVIDMLRQK